MVENNRVTKIAIVGATGTVGSFIVAELLKRGQHTVTALTRASSPCAPPSGVQIATVDYAKPETLVAALRGQDVLIITMSVRAPKETQLHLVDAAAAAGVPFVLPNHWCPDVADTQFGEDILLGPTELEARTRIEELGVSAWVGMVTSFWYEYSLGFGPTRYGLDWKERSFTFFDEGETKINTITWPQSGRAVASLLSLPLEPETEGGPSLSGYKNKFVYVSSFCVDQKAMFESVLRVSGTSRSDWTIKHEETTQRYADAKKRLFAGDRAAFSTVLYGRVFFQDGVGNYEARRGLDNDVLGLPKEDIDEFTKIAIQRAEAGIGYN